MLRLFAVIAVVLTLAATSVTATAAQDASPIASPGAGPCDAPALPPGTPTPQEPEGTPAASPAADDMAGMEMGTPEAVEEAEEVAEAAEEEASPEAERPAGTPADAATAEEATAAAENFVNCLAGGNAEAVAALVTENFLLANLGTANPYDLVAQFGEVPPIATRSIDNPQSYDDGRVSVDVTYSGFFAFGPNQINRDRWYFVNEGDYWLVDAREALPVGMGTSVDVEMVDYAFVLSQDTFPAGEVISFDIVNAGEYPHEFVVVGLPEGVTVEQVLEDPSLEEQIAFYGVNFADPGGNASFALENLEAGTYTVVCFVDVPEDVPHVVRGMVAEFTVQ